MFEAMVMHAVMRDVRGHAQARGAAAQFEKRFGIGGVELEQGTAHLKALGPISPAARGVATVDGEHGRARRRGAIMFEQGDFLRRTLPEGGECRGKIDKLQG
jgi:hypothetical protein